MLGFFLVIANIRLNYCKTEQIILAKSESTTTKPKKIRAIIYNRYKIIDIGNHYKTY
jgi:hypothetical protein